MSLLRQRVPRAVIATFSSAARNGPRPKLSRSAKNELFGEVVIRKHDNFDQGVSAVASYYPLPTANWSIRHDGGNRNFSFAGRGWPIPLTPKTRGLPPATPQPARSRHFLPPKTRQPRISWPRGLGLPRQQLEEDLSALCESYGDGPCAGVEIRGGGAAANRMSHQGRAP